MNPSRATLNAVALLVFLAWGCGKSSAPALGKQQESPATTHEGGCDLDASEDVGDTEDASTSGTSGDSEPEPGVSPAPSEPESKPDACCLPEPNGMASSESSPPLGASAPAATSLTYPAPVASGGSAGTLPGTGGTDGSAAPTNTPGPPVASSTDSTSGMNPEPTPDDDVSEPDETLACGDAGRGALCGSECVDLLNDNRHCGACGRECPVHIDARYGALGGCRQGACFTMSPCGGSSCNQVCADLGASCDNIGCSIENWVDRGLPYGTLWLLAYRDRDACEAQSSQGSFYCYRDIDGNCSTESCTALTLDVVHFPNTFWRCCCRFDSP